MNPVKAILRKLLPKNQFARGVSVLVGGTAGAQLMMVLALPLLTRLYSPEDFGLLAVYAGVLSLFTVIASLRYELAIPLPEDDQVAVNLVILCLFTVLGMTLISALLMWFAGSIITIALGVPVLTPYLWLLPIGVLMVGVYQTFSYWAIRTKQFPTIARTRLRQAITTIGIQLLAFKAGSVALLLGQVCGQGMGSITLARGAMSRAELRQWRWKEVRRAASRYRQFPMFSTWSGFFNTAGSQLPPLMLAGLFGAGAAGLYVIAHRVLALPMSLIGQAIGNVFFSNAAKAYRVGELGPLVSGVHDKLANIAMPPALVLMAIGPELFTLVFGEGWRESGELARWMAPWLYMVFITSPLSTLFSVMEKERQGMFFQAILLISRVAGITIGAAYGDLMMAVVSFSFVSALCWAGFLIWIAWSTGNKLDMIFRPMSRAFVISILCVSPVWLTANWPVSTIVWWTGLLMSMLLIGLHYLRLFKKAY